MRKIVFISAILATAGLYAQDLTILHVNDTHSHIEPERSGRHDGCGGVIELAAYVDSVRCAEGNSNVMLVHAGDFSQGTSYFTRFEGNIEVDVLNAIGFDATCLVYSSAGVTHGWINARQALCVSCNYFFYELADNANFNWKYMDDAAKGLGLGELTGIELYEKQGQRANPETKKKLYDKDHQAWTAADSITSSIGQNDHRFTPLQLCVYTTTLANQGTRYSATFLNRVVSTDYRSLVMENEKEIASVMEIPNDAVISYMEGMQMVASYFDGALKGTAYNVFQNYPIPICAKTGTAQTGINGQDDNGAFLCFAPANDPQIAIAVYGEKAGSGSVMGNVAKGILDSFFEVGAAGDIQTYENTMS